MARKRNLYDPSSPEPYRLSRSKLEDFLRCPRCFYLDRRLGVAQPPGFPFNLNSAVDELLKREFDGYRERQEPHPLFKEHDIDAVPFAHPDIDDWRNNFKGIRYKDNEKNYNFGGAIDDVWIKPNGDLIISDVKATSKKVFNWEETKKMPWGQGYKRQLEMYQWLFRKNGFKRLSLGEETALEPY